MSCKITLESIIKFLQYDLLLKLETSSIHVECYSLSNSFYFIILCYIEQKICLFLWSDAISRFKWHDFWLQLRCYIWFSSCRLYRLVERVQTVTASAHERFLPQRWNSRSGRVFLGCAHGRWKKRNVLTFCSLSVSVCGMDFVESVAVCALLLRTRAKGRVWFWVHPLVSQRLLKG